MRIMKLSALVVASIVALACGYAAAVEGEDLGEGGGAATAPAVKAAPAEGAATHPAGQDQQQAPQRRKSFWENNTMLLVMLGAVVLLFVMTGRSKRKQAAKRKEMLAGLKKGAKITTIGGIIGSVVEVRDDEVTIKIGEASNARMRLARWAIRGVGEEAKAEDPDQKK